MRERTSESGSLRKQLFFVSREVRTPALRCRASVATFFSDGVILVPSTSTLSSADWLLACCSPWTGQEGASSNDELIPVRILKRSLATLESATAAAWVSLMLTIPFKVIFALHDPHCARIRFDDDKNSRVRLALHRTISNVCAELQYMCRSTTEVAPPLYEAWLVPFFTQPVQPMEDPSRHLRSVDYIGQEEKGGDIRWDPAVPGQLKRDPPEAIPYRSRTVMI